MNCPECNSSGPFSKDGFHVLADGSETQRFLCRVCGFRFSESKSKTVFTDSARYRAGVSPQTEECTLFQPVQNIETGDISTW